MTQGTVSAVSAEQQARDLLERCGVEDAQSFTAGDVVELANLIARHYKFQPPVGCDQGAVRWVYTRPERGRRNSCHSRRHYLSGGKIRSG
jgi:hypothetical protein